MIKSEELNKLAKDLYFKILSTFKPTFSAINLNVELENFVADKTMTLSGEEENKLLNKTKKLLANYIDSRLNKGSFSKFKFSDSDDD